MIEHVIGDYLISKGVISKAAFDSIADRIYSEKMLLGSIAVREKLLTEKQVAKIHNMQKTVDKKFGEIAVQYGGLTEENLDMIIKKQKDLSKDILTYIEESGVMSRDELMCELECFRNDYELTQAQLEDLLDDDIDEITAVFVRTKNFYTNEYYHIALKFIMRFLGDKVHIGELKRADEHYCERVIAQKLRTEEARFAIGISGSRESLHEINDMLDAFDGTIQPDNRYSQLFGFVNCISCIFECSIMRELKIQSLSMPATYKNTELIFSNDGFILPITVGNIGVDIVVASGTKDNFVKVLHNI